MSIFQLFWCANYSPVLASLVSICLYRSAVMTSCLVTRSVALVLLWAATENLVSQLWSYYVLPKAVTRFLHRWDLWQVRCSSAAAVSRLWRALPAAAAAVCSLRPPSLVLTSLPRVRTWASREISRSREAAAMSRHARPGNMLSNIQSKHYMHWIIKRVQAK